MSDKGVVEKRFLLLECIEGVGCVGFVSTEEAAIEFKADHAVAVRAGFGLRGISPVSRAIPSVDFVDFVCECLSVQTGSAAEQFIHRLRNQSEALEVVLEVVDPAQEEARIGLRNGRGRRRVGLAKTFPVKDAQTETPDTSAA